ncbi:MAG: TraB family protein [Candidatus Nanohaloarchaea archaeon]
MRKEVELDGRKVTVIGTSHVSSESRDEVREAVEELEPDLVGVELDEDRYESLKNRSGWRDLDIAEAIRDGRGSLLLMNLLLAIYQRRIGMEQGMEPGAEMLEAVETAETHGIRFSLLDRDISETFGRLRSELSLWQKFTLAASFLAGEEDVDVEELKQADVLESILGELDEDFPSVSKVLLDERNSYMAGKLLEEDFEHAVVVVGAAHVEGLVEELKDSSEPEISGAESGKGFPWMKALNYGIPLFILGMLGYSFYKIGFATGIEASAFWILANGLLAMAGAIAARSHVATWIVSFIAAPLTSLDPALGAGMVASYFEARFYPPTVGELEDVVYLDRYRELWSNQAGRILLTFIFVTIGSAIATFIGAGYIASLLL